jgi:hypothetical protein
MAGNLSLFPHKTRPKIIVLPKALAIMFENQIVYTSPIRRLINYLKAKS